jgi:cyclopropane fatty-acyl-phospholipid synthase-like methyltransferase
MPLEPDRSVFETFYAEKAPWDIGRPQQPFIKVADRINGSILDCGCGTGETALFFAARGCTVTGIDFLPVAIERAQRKATERKLSATFLVKDALTLADWSARFDNVIDSGLFHVFDDDNRRRYVAGLVNVLKSGGRLFMMCFSDDEPGREGPRRVAKKELHDAFAAGWIIESIEQTRFAVRPDIPDLPFSEGGPKAWFVIGRRA